VNFLGAAGQCQQGPIKGEAVALALLQARQHPVGQQIGGQQGGVRQRFRGQARGRQLAERLLQCRVVVDLPLPNPQPRPQLADGAMAAEPSAQRVILSPKKVFAQIAQEMEVTVMPSSA